MNTLNNLTVTSWWWVRHAPVTSHHGRLYGQSDVLADGLDSTHVQDLDARNTLLGTDGPVT